MSEDRQDPGRARPQESGRAGSPPSDEVRGLRLARDAWRRVANAVGPGPRGTTAPGPVPGRSHQAPDALAASYPGTDGAGPGLAHLLDPELRTVPWTGRDLELAEMVAWCREPRPVQVRLTTGSGGSGKTRLAIEAARRLTRAGWRCVWIRPGSDATRAVREIGAGRRTLVVIDDAASRADLVALLDGLPRQAGSRLRVLLLSRTGREWWYHLRWASTLWCDDGVHVSHTHLAPPDDQGAREAVASAVRAFARRFGTVAPAPVIRPARDPASVLDLHAVALLAVAGAAGRADGTAAEPSVVVDPSRAIGDLLDHERARWTAAAARAGLPVDDVDDAIAAGMLLGAGTDADAHDVLRRTAPVLATPAGVAWLRGTGTFPYRLSEHHIARVLAATPWFADDWTRALPAATAHRVVVITSAIQAEPPSGTDQGAVDAVLRHVVSRMPADADALASVLRLLPQRPEPPGDLAEALTARVLGLGATTTTWADALTHRARALGTLGRHADALQTGYEAVTAWRAEAEADPRRYGSSLARALCAVGSARHGLGRYAEAREALTEALGLLRRIPADEAEWTQPELARVLSVLGAANRHLGREDDHEQASLEEVAVLRRLVDRDPAQFEAQLGRALLGRLVLADLGRPLEALASSTEALDLWRRLARRHAVDVEPQLAYTLSARSSVLAELGRLEEAIVAETEALEMRRHLAAAEPERYEPELATSLARLGAHLSSFGRAQHAHALETEALAIRRRLVRQNARAYAYMLASSLSNLGVTCSRLGRYAEALPLELEAVAIRRDLARDAPERYEQYLARSLSNLGVRYSDVGEPALAVEPTVEAVEILRRLAAEDRHRYKPDLASACTNLGATYADLGHATQAADLLRESSELLRDLAGTYPARFRPGLAQACSMLAALEIRLGRADAAVDHATEAVAIRRDLVTLHGDRYRDDLELSLAVLSEACDPRHAAPVRSRASSG